MSCCNEPTFYACDSCKIVIEEIQGKKGEFTCCGTSLKPLVANVSEGAQEKHLPAVEVSGNCVTVKVGSVPHPMSEEHSIEWVYLRTEKGCQRINLAVTNEPLAVFMLADGDKPIAAYAYCNLHGFWQTNI